MDLFTQPLSPAALAVVTILCLAAIVLLLRLGRKQSQAVSAKFLAAHPDAATLYIYAQDLDRSGGEVECFHGTASRLFDSIDVPQPLMKKGLACHLLPGKTELLATLPCHGKPHYLLGGCKRKKRTWRKASGYGGSHRHGLPDGHGLPDDRKPQRPSL